MTNSDIAALAAEIAEEVGGGCRWAYGQWMPGEAPDPPYLIYNLPGGEDFYADDENYQGIEPLHLELYTFARDPGAEAAAERILRRWELQWTRSRVYIETERIHETLYELEVMMHA
jgi:hypothetical protein